VKIYTDLTETNWKKKEKQNHKPKRQGKSFSEAKRGSSVFLKPTASAFG